MQNLLPGDTESIEYTVTIRHKRATCLLFEIKNVKEPDNGSALSKAKLSDVLTVKIETNGKELYNGSFLNVPRSAFDLTTGSTSQEVTYDITVSMPKSAGNEYQRKSLSADFVWTLEIEDEPDYPYIEPDPDIPDTTEADTTEADTTEADTTEADTEPDDPYEPWETTGPDTEPIEPPDTEPPVTEPPSPPESDPSETDPPLPPDVHDDCCPCIVCHLLGTFFGNHRETCFTCELLSNIFNSDALLHCCPWGCMIFWVAVISTVAVTIIKIIEKITDKDEDDENDDNQNDNNGEEM